MASKSYTTEEKSQEIECALYVSPCIACDAKQETCKQSKRARKSWWFWRTRVRRCAPPLAPARTIPADSLFCFSLRILIAILRLDASLSAILISMVDMMARATVQERRR